ncbi:MAG: peptide chain release factor N(5)-glutamine methyltransferase [Clostridiales bacterium]|nr:peptide chain release factor N(5)-glutamine methyltransferase [Clostridiales bacterium]
MVIREILKKADKILSDNGIEDSYNESTILFVYVLNKSKTYIYTHMDVDVDVDVELKFLECIKKRSKSMPVAYIVNKAWFMSLELFVNEATLIPRPETEGLVEEVLRVIKESSEEKVELLDICTGSGCIGLAVAYYNKKVEATLSDINLECIEVSRKNILMNNLEDRVKVTKSNLFSAFNNLKFDVITANPPYIPSEDIRNLDSDVRLYEPLCALDGGTDGLDFYRNIAAETKNHLKENGCLFMEIGINQSEAVKEILRKSGYANISIKNDISEIPRIITASRTSSLC